MSSTNPYEAPAADIQAAEFDRDVDIPEEVSKRIRNAVGAGIFGGAATLIFVVAAIVMHTPIMGLDAWSLFDVATVFGLTFGIYKKSRVCAVLMLLYYAANKVMQIVVLHAYAGIIPGAIFGYLYFMGVAGTFEYHKLVKEAEDA